MLSFSSHPLPNQCQAEDKQRGVFEPGDPVAEAVPEERFQQVRISKSSWFQFSPQYTVPSGFNKQVVSSGMWSLTLYRNLKQRILQHKGTNAHLDIYQQTIVGVTALNCPTYTGTQSQDMLVHDQVGVERDSAFTYKVWVHLICS